MTQIRFFDRISLARIQRLIFLEQRTFHAAEVREQILKFMESSRYEEYLCTKIEEAVCFAEHDEIKIYLSTEDEPRLKPLKESKLPQSSSINFIGLI